MNRQFGFKGWSSILQRFLTLYVSLYLIVKYRRRLALPRKRLVQYTRNFQTVKRSPQKIFKKVSRALFRARIHDSPNAFSTSCQNLSPQFSLTLETLEGMLF